MGLLHEDGITLGDGNKVLPSPGQRWMYSCWKDFISQAKSRAAGKKVYVVGNGDLTDGDHHDTSQIITRNRTTQRSIAIDCIEPLAEIADRLFIVRGTPIHVKNDEEEIAKDLGAEKFDNDIYSWWELIAEFGDKLFDISHHPPGGGGQPWTRGGAAVRLAGRSVMEYAGRGEKIPDMIIRGHYHLYQDSFENIEGCRAIYSPGWQLRTEFTWRIAAQRADIGAILFDIKSGEMETKVIRYRPTRRPIWKETSQKKTSSKK